MFDAEVLALSRKGKLREQSLKMQFFPQVLRSSLVWLSSDNSVSFSSLPRRLGAAVPERTSPVSTDAGAKYAQSIAVRTSSGVMDPGMWRAQSRA